MKYMLLIYADEQVWTDAEREQCYQESTQLTHELKARGQYLGASPLHSVSMATSVQVRNDKRLITDGPFAETREQLGGYSWWKPKTWMRPSALPRGFQEQKRARWRFGRSSNFPTCQNPINFNHRLEGNKYNAIHDHSQSKFARYSKQRISAWPSRLSYRSRKSVCAMK